LNSCEAIVRLDNLLEQLFNFPKRCKTAVAGSARGNHSEGQVFTAR